MLRFTVCASSSTRYQLSIVIAPEWRTYWSKTRHSSSSKFWSFDLTDKLVFFFSEEELETLSLVAGYNVTDSTYGWDGMSGYTIHYSHFTDMIDEHSHQLPLSSGLIPNVYFQNVEKVFLGEPFTSCIKTSAINSYVKWVSKFF